LNPTRLRFLVFCSFFGQCIDVAGGANERGRHLHGMAPPAALAVTF
jgi:hypothetical protein